MRAILLDGLWGAPWRLFPFRRALLSEGFSPVEIFSYDSSGFTPLEVIADQFVQFWGEQKAVVVAHSMGGLIVRLAKFRYPQLPIVASAFLCVPHHGSILAHLLPFPAIRQLRPKSELLQLLASQVWEIPTLAVWCPGDLLVVPGSSAKWEKATEILRCDVPLHNWPLFSPAFQKASGNFFKKIS